MVAAALGVVALAHQERSVTVRLEYPRRVVTLHGVHVPAERQHHTLHKHPASMTNKRHGTYMYVGRRHNLTVRTYCTCLDQTYLNFTHDNLAVLIKRVNSDVQEFVFTYRELSTYSQTVVTCLYLHVRTSTCRTCTVSEASKCTALT